MTAPRSELKTVSPLATPLPRVLRPRRALPTDTVRPTRAEVSLANLRYNLRVLKRQTRSPIFSVLKADAYGHGAKAVARTLERAGGDGVCVALLEEAVELREAGIAGPILVMGGYYGTAWGELLHHNLTPVVYELGQIEALAEEVRFAGAEPVSIHLKVDTGMGRLGVMPKELAEIGAAIARRSELCLHGLMTHFACADTSLQSIHEQLDCFDRASAELERLGLKAKIHHAANSAAILSCERAHLDLVRPGIALFGVQPAPGMGPALRPVMRVRSEIIALRDLAAGQTTGYGATWRAQRPSKLATIPLGYADGLSRIASNNGHVLVRGKRAPIAGAVSMDLTTIDVTDVDGVQITDEVVMLGKQSGPLGEDTISAGEIATRQNTISWEVLTNVSRRVPRFYRES